MVCGREKWGYSSPHPAQIDAKVGNINGLSVITDSIVGDAGAVEVGHGWQRWSRGREERRSRGMATDSQGHAEAHRAPTGAGIAAGVDRDAHSHAQPLRRATGHDRRHRVRSIHPPRR